MFDLRVRESATSSQSALASLACRIAAIAFGLASGLIFNDAGNPRVLGGIPLIGFSPCLSFGGRQPGIFLGLQPLLLGGLDAFAFGASFFPGRCQGLPLGLLGGCQRPRSRPCGAEIFKLCLFCSGRSVEAIGKVGVSLIDQIAVPYPGLNKKSQAFA